MFSLAVKNLCFILLKPKMNINSFIFQKVFEFYPVTFLFLLKLNSLNMIKLVHLFVVPFDTSTRSGLEQMGFVSSLYFDGIFSLVDYQNNQCREHGGTLLICFYEAISAISFAEIEFRSGYCLRGTSFQMYVSVLHIINSALLSHS